MKYGNFSLGQVEAVFNKLGGEEGVKAFLRDEFVLKPVVKATKSATENLITRTAHVNRTLTLKEAMLATGRTSYLDDKALAGMPLCTGDIVTKSFYNFGRFIGSDELNNELAKVGLELDVDPIGLAAVNETDKEFAEMHLNGTQWKNAYGNFCYMIFSRHGRSADGPTVHVGTGPFDWADYWWFPVRSK